MRRYLNFRALRPYSLILFFVGVLGLTMAARVAQALHLTSQAGKDGVDFVFGLAVGIGLSMILVAFLGEPSTPAEADE